MDPVIRDATETDAPGCRDVYAPYVTGSAVSFELEAPSAAEMARRIADAQLGHAWLVLDDGGRVAGYAYGGPFMARPAYRWSCDGERLPGAGAPPHGCGRALYEALFERLADRGLRTALAGIALPNDASVGLHRALGFEPVGTYRAVGWKDDRWHDVAWFQRALGAAGADDPPAPLS